MKSLFASILILTTLSVSAQASESYVQCYAKPTEYAGGNSQIITLPKIALTVPKWVEPEFMGQIEKVSFPLYKNYEVRISGVFGPLSMWIKDQTDMLLTVELLQVSKDGKSKQVLGSDLKSGSMIDRPAQLEDIKNGKTRTHNSIKNSAYGNMEVGAIQPDQLVLVDVTCELFH